LKGQKNFKIKVEVKLRAKTEKILRVNENFLVVYTRAEPINGKANERIRQMLSDYYQVPKTTITLLKGEKSKIKVFDILK